MKDLALIPFVCGAGATVPGAEHGPLYAHTHGLAGDLQAAWMADPETDWATEWGRAAHEHLPARGTAERHGIVHWHVCKLAERVTHALRDGKRAVVIGGDHSQAAGSVAGAWAALGPDVRLGLLWIDAHPDMHTAESSVSKAIHGMPMATLTGLDDLLTVPGQPRGLLRAEDVVYAGLRDIDPGERENAAKLGLNLLDMNDLRARGVAATLLDAAAALAARCDHIILSIDLDGFSLDAAPAVGSPVPGGFTPDEILPVLAEIVQKYSIPLIDIVEFNPTLPGAEETFGLVQGILKILLMQA